MLKETKRTLFPLPFGKGTPAKRIFRPQTNPATGNLTPPPPMFPRSGRREGGTGTGTGTGTPCHVWLLRFVHETGEEGDVVRGMERAFPTREEAVASLPGLMDGFCPYDRGWRDGLAAFGRGGEENYCGFSYHGAVSEAGGGVIISNGRPLEDDPITVRLERRPVGP